MVYLQSSVSMLSLFSYAAYFGYRVFVIRRSMIKYGERQSVSWTFLVAEGVYLCTSQHNCMNFLTLTASNPSSTVPVYLHSIFLSLAVKMRKRPRLRLQGDVVPAVDVLLTTCGEPVDMIVDTIRAACNLDYPVDRYRIIVCDDGADSALGATVAQLAQQYPQLFYHARIKGKVHHYKAGNLQAGIDFSRTLPGGAGQMIATLDADMIPEQFWLRGSLPHILRDEKMALCAPPQASHVLAGGLKIN